MSEREIGSSLDRLQGPEEKIKFFKEAAQKAVKEFNSNDSKIAPEVNNETIEAQKEETVKNDSQLILSAVEQEAVKLGWDPTGESAKKAGKRALSAEEFVDRQSLFDKIDGLKKEVQKQKEFTRKQAEFTKQATEQAYKQALDDFNRQKLEAVAVGDIKGFQTIEAKVLNTQQKLIDLEKNVQLDDEEQVQVLSSNTGKQNSLPKETIEFAERNRQWFNTHTPLNTAMGNFAAGIDAQIEASQPKLTLSERYILVEEEVRKAFPQQFENKRQEAVPAVAVDTIKGSSDTKSASLRDLTPAQRYLGEQFVQKGAYKNLNEYAQVLKDRGQLKTGDRR